MELREALDRILCALFPPRCLSCNDVVYYEDVFCEKCGFERAGPEDCRHKLRSVPVSGAIAAASFSGDIKKAIYLIKDKPDIRVRNFFAAMMLEEIKRSWANVSFDAVTAVPLSPEKCKKRGFNQAGMLANALAGLLKAPYLDHALMQKDDAQTQHSLDYLQREKNAKKAFYLADSSLVRDKTMLLVDDVMTTGATLRACAKLLFEGGAKAVYVVAASSTPEQEPSVRYRPHHLFAAKPHRRTLKE